MRELAPRPRHDALLAAAALLPALRTRTAAAEAIVQAVGIGDLACCVMAVDGDSASGVAISIGADSGSGLDEGSAQRLLDVVVPVDGIAVLREVVRRRAPYKGTAGAVAALAGMPSVVRSQGAEVARLRDATVVAAPIETRAGVTGVLMTWGQGCDPDTLGVVTAAAGLLSLAWDRDGSELAGGSPPRSSHRRHAGAGRSVMVLVRSGRLRAALQSIHRLHDGAIMGWEALCRFTPVARLQCPDDLFAAAAEAGLDVEVDTACIRAALLEAVNADPAPLFVNVGIAMLQTDGIVDRLGALLAEQRLQPSQTVLELSERQPVLDLHRLQQVATDLRAAGYRIAVDDAGSGHASMRLIAELRPDFIKIDQSLIRSIATDTARRALVVSLLSFGGHVGSRVIAEGIESEVERSALSDLGVQYGQGFHLGMPVMCKPPPAAPNVVGVDADWFGSQTVVGFDILMNDEKTAIRLEAPELTDAVPGRRHSLAQALSHAARALQSEHDRARILGVIAEQLARVVPVKEIAIYEADYETHRFVPLLATGPEADEILADTFALDAGLTGWAFATGLPQNVRDTSTHPVSRQIPGTPVVEESMLLLPLVAGDQRLGIINCWRSGAGRFSPADLKAASLFAHMAASAWRNAQLYSELLHAAMTDPLTGLFNTRWLHETGQRDLARSVRSGSAHAILLIDLDHFKHVNDSCGHAVGDMVLRRVARALQRLVRASDAVVRFGGEEFLIALPDTGADGAMLVADKVREAMRRLSMPERCILASLTASVGVAVHPACGADLDALIRAADGALYVAKNGGRDRGVLASPLESPGIPPAPRS